MKLEQHEITMITNGRGTVDVTTEIAGLVSTSTIHTGLCHLFLQHTSASLIICENYDAQVRKDLENYLLRLIPDGDQLFKHTAEGDDDMPAHIRTILTQTELTIPISEKTLALGTWQGIFLYEHRYDPHCRKIKLTLFGH